MKRMRKITAAVMLLIILLGCALATRALETDTSPVIRVAVTTGTPPFQFLNEQGELAGLHIDIMDQLAQKNGWELAYFCCQSQNDALSMLRAGEADIVLGAELQISAQTKDVLTLEISNADMCMITSKATAERLTRTNDYSGCDAAFQFGTISYVYTSKWHFDKCRMYSSQQRVLDSLASGDADIAFGIQQTMEYLLKQSGKEKEYAVQYSKIAPFRHLIIMRGDEIELYDTLNKSLINMRTEGEYDSLFRKWIVSSELEETRAKLGNLIRFAAVIGGAALAVLLTVLALNRLLKRRVAEKTEELSQANEALCAKVLQLQSESSLRNQIIERSPSAMLYFTADYRVALANRSAQHLCGMDGAAILGADMRELPVFGDIHRQLGEDIFLLEHAKGEFSAVTVHISSAKDTCHYRCAFAYYRDQGAVTDVLMMVEDVTRETQEMQEAYEKEKNKTLNQLIAGIAHEIKNPLMSIVMFTSMVSQQRNNEEFISTFSERVPKELERINALVESLINYARPVKGDKTNIDVSRAVEDCLYLCQPAMRKTSIEVCKALQDDLLIYANSDKLKQALINFIMNAVESMEQKYREQNDKALRMHLTIRTDAEDDFVIINVRDDGLGMTEKEIADCTRPFFTTKAQGTGMGMTLAKQFVSDNGGEICIESVKGKYASISLRFRRLYP